MVQYSICLPIGQEGDGPVADGESAGGMDARRTRAQTFRDHPRPQVCMALIESGTLPTLEGERVRLRWLSDADVPALFAIFGDPTVTRYWSTPALRDEAAAAELLGQIHDNVRTGKGFQWGIVLRGHDTVIGTCTLYNPDFNNQRTELGFALARAQWGKGLATEAIRVVLAYAFDVLGFRRIEADVDPRNDASLRVLEGVGFIREGFLRERYNVDGEIQDSVYLGLLRSDWTGARGGAQATMQGDTRR